MNEKERDEAHVEQHGDGDVNITVEQDEAQTEQGEEQVENKEESD